MSAPKGNAQVGDTVWYRQRNGDWACELLCGCKRRTYALPYEVD